jgi:hypothetical protein
VNELVVAVDDADMGDDALLVVAISIHEHGDVAGLPGSGRHLLADLRAGQAVGIAGSRRRALGQQSGVARPLGLAGRDAGL